MTAISENKSQVNKKALLSSVLDNYAKKENVKGMKDLVLYRYESASRVTLVLHNLVSFVVGLQPYIFLGIDTYLDTSAAIRYTIRYIITYN